MSDRRTPHRNPTPALGPGRAGLPKGMSPSPVVPSSPLSLLAARAAMVGRGAAARLDALGFVCTPDISLAEALGAVAGTKGQAARIFLTEGTWHFKDTAQFAIARTGVELISLSPGRTRFRREVATGVVLSRSYLFDVTGQYFKLCGVRIEEPGNADYPSISLDGDYAEVVGCRFDAVYGAVVVSSNYNAVLNNLILNNTAADAIRVASGTGNNIDGNTVV